MHEGELVGSRLQNILRGVNSARIYLKQANERAERRLLSIETAAALRTLREDVPLPAADLRLAWRDLLRNHPHDSICGCSCDEVHRDMLVRYEQLGRTLGALEEGGPALVNPLPYQRARLVQRDGREGLVELDGFTGRIVELAPAEPHASAGGTSIENDGRRRLVDGEAYELDGFSGARPAPFRSRGPLINYERIAELIAFEDEPDAGDLYTFCPGGAVRRAELVGSHGGDGLVLEHELPGVRIETTIRRPKGLDRFELTSVIENEAEDHRLRVLIRYDGADDEVRAESQFAVVRRPLAPLPPRFDWVEPPVPTAHTLGAVALGPLVLLTKGLPEYEASEDGLRLTLLRCVGTISRPAGLPTRPLAAGPEIATPDGQCRECHVFEYSLRFDGDELSNASLLRASQDYRTDFLHGDPFEPPLELGGDVVFSCLKPAEDDSGLVLRVFNPNPQPELLTLNVPARRIRLDEAEAVDGGLELAPDEIATFLIGD